MKCQHCPKMVTRQITEIHSEDNVEVLRLCDECAQKHLTEMIGKKDDPERELPSVPDKQCEKCGTKFVDFRNSGRLGCPHDYEAFESELLPLLESIHSSTRHAGKTPRHPHRRDTSRMLSRLRADLARAVDGEDYEEAARLRDLIKLAGE